jgi:hypothetical protein
MAVGTTQNHLAFDPSSSLRASRWRGDRMPQPPVPHNFVPKMKAPCRSFKQWEKQPLMDQDGAGSIVRICWR